MFPGDNLRGWTLTTPTRVLKERKRMTKKTKKKSKRITKKKVLSQRVSHPWLVSVAVFGLSLFAGSLLARALKEYHHPAQL